MKKILKKSSNYILLFLIFSLVSISFIFAENKNLNSDDFEKIQDYSNNFYITYLILIGIFFALTLIALIMIAQNFTWKYLFKYLGLFLFLLIIGLIFFMF